MQSHEYVSDVAGAGSKTGYVVRNLGRFSPAVLLGAGQTTLLISLPAMVAETGIGYETLTAMIALGTCLFIVSAPSWGRISDSHGRKIVVSIGLAGFAASYSLIAFAVYWLTAGIVSTESAIGLMFVARIIYGLTVSGLYPALQAWAIDDTDSSARVRSLSHISASINTGRLLGPVIPAALIDHGSMLPVLVLSLLSAPLLLLISLQESCSSRAQNLADKNPGTGQLQRLVFSFWPILLVACSVTTLFGLLQYLIGPIMQQRFGFGGVEASRILSMLMMAAALSTIVAHLLLSRWNQGRLINKLKTGSVLLLTGCLGIVFAEKMIWLLAGLVICAASIALLTPVYTTIAITQAGKNRGLLTGTLSMIHTTGYTLGALLGGVGVTLENQLAVVFCISIAVLNITVAFLLVDSSDNNN